MSLRLFAALDIPDDIADRLLPLQKGIGGAKWRPRENLHVTLRFFGEVPEPVADDIDGELLTIAENHTAFEIALKGAGTFGGADPHALWMGVAASEPLKKLAADCERAARRAKLKPDPHAFKPHVTMAYLNNAPLDRVQSFEQRFALFETPPFRVRELWALLKLHTQIGPEPLQARGRISVARIVLVTRCARALEFPASAVRCRAPTSLAAGSGPSRSNALALQAPANCSGIPRRSRSAGWPCRQRARCSAFACSPSACSPDRTCRPERGFAYA